MTKCNIGYMYRIVYKNGSIYDQNVEDISITDPSKSCYFDIKVDDVKYFTLSNGLDSYTLDLQDGGISVNGSNKIYLTIESLKNFRLVYFRRITMQIGENTRCMVVKHVLGYTAQNTADEPVTYSIIIV